jgi:MFS family permease
MISAASSDDQQMRRARALRFVLLIGVLSLFADFTYEGSRSILGPYLLVLGASATLVGIITGLGELAGYGLRFFSGRWADQSGQFWPIIIFGYVLQMSVVPALAFASSWQVGAVLIILERIGKAIRNPPRDTMLAHAGTEAGGYGFVFGIHQLLDQCGAMLGPLTVSAVLAWRHELREAFLVLAIPAAINIALVITARLLYPRPQDLAAHAPEAVDARLPRVYWIYMSGAALAAVGFADYPLIAYHFSRTHVVPSEWVAIFYAIAMAVSGTGSFVFGRLFDRYGFSVLVGLTIASALFAPLVFLGGFEVALLGAALWGLGMGVHESIIPAAVAPMAPVNRRASAFGIFTGVYGVFWFLGSAAIGFLYDHSLMATIAFCVVTEIAAVPIFVWVSRHTEKGKPA